MAKREDYDSAAPETIVGASVKIEGDLVSEGDIRVEGTVSGKIKTSKNLYIGPAAKIEADVEAGNAILAGTVKGDLKVRENLLLEATGKVSGNIACGKLSITEGAQFNGSCSMPEADTLQPEEAEE